MTYPQYHIPRTKGDLIEAISPTWAGAKTALRGMGYRQLAAIFHTHRKRQIKELS